MTPTLALDLARDAAIVVVLVYLGALVMLSFALPRRDPVLWRKLGRPGLLDGESGSVFSISKELSESEPTDVAVSLLVAVVRLGTLILPALMLAFIGLTILVTY